MSARLLREGWPRRLVVRVARVALLACGLVPVAAHAGEMSAALALGVGWGAQTLGIARGLFPLMLILAILVELLFVNAGRTPSLRAPLWRGVVVFALLVRVSPPASVVAPAGVATSVAASSAGGGAASQGTSVFGWCAFELAGLSDSIAEALAPGDVWGQFKAVNAKWQAELVQAHEDGDVSMGEGVSAGLGGYVFGALIALGLVVGQGAMWVVTELSKVIAILLYAVGPLALVCWVPSVSDSLGRWLRTFISVLVWPVISALLMSVIARSGLRGLEGASPAFASIATALLLAVCACAVPLVASALVGSGAGVIGAGLATLTQVGSVPTGMAAGARGAVGRWRQGGGGPEGAQRGAGL